MWCRIPLCVQRNFSRLGMRDETSPLQNASHSWILGRVSFDCIGLCTIDSLISRSLSCGPRRVAFQHVVLVQFSGTGIQNTPSQRPADRSLRYVLLLCSPSKLLRVTRHHLSGSLHSDLNVQRVVTAIRRPWNGSYSKPWNGSYSKYSVRVPSFRLQGISSRSPHVS